MKKRFALVGASNRALDMFAKPIQRYGETAALIAICDPSPIMIGRINKEINQSLPAYTDFDAMLAKEQFDTLIVATVDAFHHEYIIRGLKAGKDVITEKPMTIDAEKCRAILAAEKESGRTVTVTFNYRWTPPATLIRNQVQAGAIGDVVNVDLHWPLDQRHGADYFRRWHAYRRFSGGLQVHKSTHHFDLVNWILNDSPVRVSAQGGLAFYGRKGPFRHNRCLGCPHQRQCKFYRDIENPKFVPHIYREAEPETHYYRDGCVFREDIDIEDNYQVMVQYKCGAMLSYSLQAFSPWEGYRLEIQGTKGRLEYLELHSAHDWSGSGKEHVVVFSNGSRTVHTPPKAEGTHGGGDPLLQAHLFGPTLPPDPAARMAGSMAGAHSILVGIAATRSMQNGNAWVSVEELLRGDAEGKR